MFTDNTGTQQTVLIEGATERAYRPGPGDYGCALVFSYTPVRNDGEEGEPVDSQPSAPISAGPPRVLSFQVVGSPVEAEILSAVGEFSENTRLDRSQFQWLAKGCLGKCACC